MKCVGQDNSTVSTLNSNEPRNTSTIQEFEQITESESEINSKKFKLASKCFENLGCVTSDDFFDSLKTLPLAFSDPETMNVSFILFTRNNRNSSQIFNYRSNVTEITNSFFRANRKTKFIIHGYFSSFEVGEWMDRMKNYFLDYSDFNVFAVDWSKAAYSLNYFQSAADTRVVGLIVASFVRILVDETGAKPKDMHCVGHSLGAHICGFAGQQLRNLSLPKFNETTGLDPAGPGFLLNDINTRLDPSDAGLVLVIHSNAGIFTSEGSFPIELTGIVGNPRNLGHFDFWPNGGSRQPDCQKELICNHGRSHEYPITSPNHGCQYVGYKCESYSDFQEGKCADCGTDNNKCKPMEFDLKFWDNFDRSQLSSPEFQKYMNNDFYLKTSDSEPFCVFHYQILVQVAGDNVKKLRGRLEITVNVNTTVTFPQREGFLDTLIPETRFDSGTNYTQLYLHRNELRQTNNIRVKWTSFSKNSIKIERISINFMSHLNESTRKQKSNDFCMSFEPTIIMNGNSVEFQKC